jgi:Mrp family chromosome partitioning ATPase/capsular polysaccharide biosynthesis protein
MSQISITDSPHESAMVPYLRAVGAHVRLVVLLTLLTFTAATAYAVHRPPRYTATADVLVTPLPQDDRNFLGIQMIRDSGDPTRTVQTAASLVDTPHAAMAAAQRLGDATREEVAAAVHVQPVGQSNVLGVSASAATPQRAAAIANAYATSALALRNAALRRQIGTAIATLRSSPTASDPTRLAVLESVRNGVDPTLSVSLHALAPGGRDGTSTRVIAAVSLFAGFLVASIVALLLERLDGRIREEEDLVATYRLPVLASVPPFARPLFGPRTPASAFAMPDGVREAFRGVQVQLDQRDGPGRTVMVTSASQGDGKTTSAINLAFALVAAGHSVILIDLDLRKPDIGRRLGISPDEPGVAALITTDARPEDLLVQAPGLGPLKVLPAGADAGHVVLLDELSRRVSRLLEEAAELADYVVVDTAPLGEIRDSLRIALEVEYLVVVARLGNTNRRGLEQLRDLLGRNERIPDGFVLIGGEVEGGSYYYRYGATEPAAPPAPRRLSLRALIGD